MAVLFTFHLPLQVAYSDPPGLFPDASRCSFRSRSGSLLLMLTKGVSLFLVAVPNSVPPLRGVPLFNSSVLSLTMPSASFYCLANATEKKNLHYYLNVKKDIRYRSQTQLFSLSEKRNHFSIKREKANFKNLQS